MTWLNGLVLLLYACMMVGIAIYTRKKIKSSNDFLLAGSKGLNGWMSAFSYGTTYFSAVIFIGYAGKFGWDFGLASTWIGIGNAFLGGLLAWKLLAKRTKNMTRRLKARTMPEFFEKRYNSRFLKIISAFIVFIFLIPYSASVYNGLGNLFEIMFNIDGTIVMIALAVITAIYLVFGGYLATSLSDFVQGIIMIVGTIIMLIFFMKAPQVNGFEGLNNLTASGFGFIETDGSGLFLTSPLVTLVSLVLLTSFGVYGLPQTVHKYYSVRDKKAIIQGMIVSTLFALLIGIIAYFVGGLGRLFFSEVPSGGTDNIIPIMLNQVIPNGLSGLIAVLILSASMSTLASVSLSSSSVVSVDLYKGAINKDADDKRVTLVLRIMCTLFVVVSVVIALLNKKFNITAIAFLMSLSWGTLSGCFFGPFVLGLYSKKLTKAGATASIVGGLIFTLVMTIAFGLITCPNGASFGVILQCGVKLSPLTGILCMAFSLIVTWVVSLFTKKLDEETVYNAFDKTLEDEIK